MTDTKTLDGSVDKLLRERRESEITLSRTSSLIVGAVKEIIIKNLIIKYPQSYDSIYFAVKQENDNFRSTDIKYAINSLLDERIIRPHCWGWPPETYVLHTGILYDD